MNKIKFLRPVFVAAFVLLFGGALVACGDGGEGTGGGDASSHTHSVPDSAWNVTTEASCTSDGVKKGTCSVCGETVEEAIPALGHEFGEAVVVAATCTEDGSITRTCSRCHTPQTEPIPALGHVWDSALLPEYVDQMKPATCTEPGKRMARCTRCKQVGEMVIPALGHDFGTDGAVIEEPTCVKEGSRSVVCNTCGKDGVIPIPALGHDWETAFTVDKEASFEEAGSMSLHCTRCEEKTQVTVIPRLEEGVPIAYQLELVRTNGATINFAGVGYEIKSSAGETVAQGSFIGGTAVEMLPPEEYSVSVTSIPEGYTAEASYSVVPQRPVCRVTLRGSLISEPASSSQKYLQSSVMHDFTLTTTKGETLTLSELLSRKKMVLLNFWYVGCVWCRTEFPGMQKVYERFSDEVEIIAINCQTQDGRDTLDSVTKFVNSMQLTFPIVHGVQCDALMTAFGVTMFPTSVVIDGEGVVSEIHATALVEDTDGDGEYDSAEGPFTRLFEKYAKANGSAEQAALLPESKQTPEKKEELQ